LFVSGYVQGLSDINFYLFVSGYVQGLIDIKNSFLIMLPISSFFSVSVCAIYCV